MKPKRQQEKGNYFIGQVHLNIDGLKLPAYESYVDDLNCSSHKTRGKDLLCKRPL